MKMEQTECSEMSAYKIQTPVNHPKESIQHSEQGEILKSKNTDVFVTWNGLFLEWLILEHEANVLCSCDRASWHVTVHRDMWPCSVTNFFFNKTNRQTNFFKIIFVKNLYLFRAVPLPIIRSSVLYIRHWYMSSNLHTYTSAECTVESSWWWAEGLPETCRVSWQK